MLSGANDDDDLERDSSGSSELVRFQKDFISTPTFQTKVAKSGVVSVDFEAPGNLGTFIVRAYAATGGDMHTFAVHMCETHGAY